MRYYNAANFLHFQKHEIKTQQTLKCQTTEQVTTERNVANGVSCRYLLDQECEVTDEM